MRILTFMRGNRREQLKCLATFLLLVSPIMAAIVLIRHHRQLFFLANLVAGFVGWTYFEYHLHRFWTHNKNGSSREGLINRHVYHHRRPTEIKVTFLNRVFLLLFGIGLIAAAFYFNNYLTIPAGYLTGFAYSFYSHWMLHQKWSKKLFPRLHQFHIHHHSKYTDKCFGFTTTIWDRIFGTAPPPGTIISERVIRFYYGDWEKSKKAV